MDHEDALEWLIGEGGPVIRYRAHVELAGCGAPSTQRKLLAALLQTEKVRQLLAYMEEYPPIDRLDLSVLNRLHGGRPTCLENVVPRLLETGLRAGHGVLDKRMSRFRQYVDNDIVRRAMQETDRPSVEGARAIFLATLFASYFVRAGYQHDEVLRFVQWRTERLGRIAKEHTYRVHRPPSQLRGLPGRWAGKPIIRSRMDPLVGETPLPLIHDLYSLAYLPRESAPARLRIRIADIVRYTLDSRYRRLPWGYGYLWYGGAACYGCGWSVDLPDPRSTDPADRRKLLLRLDLLSRLAAARGSPWLQGGVRMMEGFETPRGTYVLPRAYLSESKGGGYYVGGEYMGLEEDRTTSKAIELESTFRVLLLKRNLGSLTGT